jgi:hypothetical protein
VEEMLPAPVPEIKQVGMKYMDTLYNRHFVADPVQLSQRSLKPSFHNLSIKRQIKMQFLFGFM